MLNETVLNSLGRLIDRVIYRMLGCSNIIDIVVVRYITLAVMIYRLLNVLYSSSTHSLYWTVLFTVILRYMAEETEEFSLFEIFSLFIVCCVCLKKNIFWFSWISINCCYALQIDQSSPMLMKTSRLRLRTHLWRRSKHSTNIYMAVAAILYS